MAKRSEFTCLIDRCFIWQRYHGDEYVKWHEQCTTCTLIQIVPCLNITVLQVRLQHDRSMLKPKTYLLYKYQLQYIHVIGDTRLAIKKRTQYLSIGLKGSRRTVWLQVNIGSGNGLMPSERSYRYPSYPIRFFRHMPSLGAIELNWYDLQQLNAFILMFGSVTNSGFSR